ncbi:type II secretion system minor pseudopilin [Indioceanicola profundi]|uniref:general secretion pathway protein GspK n=1 Tax=Indioceanicola profundi TaxID=2220096 RepID=UPI0013C52DD5|nr:type II secretion system protein GspK [Indioceanicola profundi]
MNTRSELTVAKNQIAAAKARLLADSGIEIGILGLIGDFGDGQPWPRDGKVQEFDFENGTVWLSLQDESGKIDLNQTTDEVLAALFARQGRTDGDAAVAAVNAWRQVRRSQWKQALGGRIIDEEIDLPAFLDVEELRQVPGITPEVYARIRPFLTIHSGMATVNPLVAPAEVLRALPGIDVDQVEAFLASRDDYDSWLDAPDAQDYLADTEAGAVTIQAVAVERTGARFVREAVVAEGESATRPYRILEWRTVPDEPISGTE